MALALRTRGSSNFAYAVARVQAKRAKLLAPSEYEKVLKMDVREVTRYVEDSAYKAEVDELAPRFSGLDLLEAALTVNEEGTYESGRPLGGARSPPPPHPSPPPAPTTAPSSRCGAAGPPPPAATSCCARWSWRTR